jgi:hypothetical protein
LQERLPFASLDVRPAFSDKECAKKQGNQYAANPARPNQHAVLVHNQTFATSYNN